MTDRERDVLAALGRQPSGTQAASVVARLLNLVFVTGEGGRIIGSKPCPCPWCPVLPRRNGERCATVPRASREKVARVLRKLLAAGAVEVVRLTRGRSAYMLAQKELVA